MASPNGGVADTAGCLATALAHLGREAEVQRVVSRLLEFEPNFRISESFKKNGMDVAIGWASNCNMGQSNSSARCEHCAASWCWCRRLTIRAGCVAASFDHKENGPSTGPAAPGKVFDEVIDRQSPSGGAPQESLINGSLISCGSSRNCIGYRDHYW
jgi:hypothetical protein